MSREGRFENKPLEERRQRFEELAAKHPKKLPLVFQRSSKSNLAGVESFRFVSNRSTKLSHFAQQIRNSLSLSENAQLFFTNRSGTILKPESLIEDIAKGSVGEDRFVYVDFQEVQSFGFC